MNNTIDILAAVLDGFACVRCEIMFSPGIASVPSGNDARGQVFRCADSIACLQRMFAELDDDHQQMLEAYADRLRDGSANFHPWQKVSYRGVHWVIDRCHANGDLTLVGPDDDQHIEPIVVPLIDTLDVHVI